MMNYLQYYFECTNSLAHEISETVNRNTSSSTVSIQITIIYNKDVYFHYNIERDELVVEAFRDKMKYKYPSFSQLKEESYHFQKMTIWPHISFESTDVEAFMNEIDRIREEHETKLTKNT